ncbi:NADH-quinone oxidoreductase subunit N [bacterium]|nr:NADH-quinone oxidoreductase subunit N [bacterium]
MNEVLSVNFFIIAPAVILTIVAFVIVGLALFVPKIGRWIHLGLALFGLVVALGFSFVLFGENEIAFGGMVSVDDFSLSFNCIFIIGAFLSVLLATNPHEESYLLYPEFFAIILFATVGMILMAASTSLLTIFLGLETLSISLYVLAGIKRTENRSLEAAFKYFLLGAFSSGFLLYGIAFLYGATGSLDLVKMAMALKTQSTLDSPFLILGGLFIIVGLGFKVAVVPFHMWAPDVYEGAPTPITAFMSTGSKAAGFAAMLRVVFSATDGTASDWVVLFWVMAVLTMFVGNIAALVQTNIKRMLAYSSVAHAGYVLVGVAAWNEIGASSVIFYLLTYTFMNVGAFGVVSILGTKEQEYLKIDDLRGLAYQKPWLAAAMAVFMFSLAGLPPTAGFVGKFYLFSAAVKADHIVLAVLGVISSMISLYYYLSVVVTMFMREAKVEWQAPSRLPAVVASLAFAVLGSLGLGLFPSKVMASFELFVNQIL